SLGGSRSSAMPALLTSTSSRPISASIQRAAAATLAASVTSSWTWRASSPSSRSRPAAASPAFGSRAPTSTAIPRRPSCRAVSRPIPLSAPVTSATRLSWIWFMAAAWRPRARRSWAFLAAIAAAKNAQAAAARAGYHRRMHLPERAPDDPLRIEISKPGALAGLVVGHFLSHGRLSRSVTDHIATEQNYGGHSEWWAHGRVWKSRPGVLKLKLPGEVHRDLRRDGPARFQVVLFHDDLIREAREALDAPCTGAASMAVDGCSPAGAP